MVGAQLALLLLPQRDPKRMKHANESLSLLRRHSGCRCTRRFACKCSPPTTGADAPDARQCRALAPAPSQLLVRPTYATKPATRAPGANRQA